MKFMENVKSAYSVDAQDELDRGDIVQTILIIAGFAIVCIAVVMWLGTAIMNKGADVAGCIEGSNSYSANTSASNCSAQNHANGHSFTSDSAYSSRYGS